MRRLFSLVLGLTLPLGVATGASAQSASSNSPIPSSAAVRAALEQLKAGAFTAGHAVNGPDQPINTVPVTSAGWAGYIDGGTNTLVYTYDLVRGRWVEPLAMCTAATSLALFLVGLDGYTSSTIEEAGTYAYCTGGTASYGTWWEMYPTNSAQVVGTTVKPGDKIQASVTEDNGKYALKVTDSTTANNDIAHVAKCPTCANSSAEWVAGRAASNGTYLPLTDFGAWKLTNAVVKSGLNTGEINTFPNYAATMINAANQSLATPRALNPDGDEFRVIWDQSA